ncbi:MAG: hypothetical protein RJB39_271 [Candidatus Parcubacteria bacterium]|jgi:hypothetical protein
MEPNPPLQNNSHTNFTGGMKPPPGTPTEAVQPKASIHTLEGDIFTAMKDDNYDNNIVKIVTKPTTNNKSSPENEEGISFTRKITLAAIILVVLTLVTVGYFWIAGRTGANNNPLDPNATTTPNTSGSTSTPITTPTTSVLGAEAIIQLNIQNLNKAEGIEKIRQIQQDLRDKQIAQGTTVELNLGLSMPELFAKNQYSGDEGLIRALTNNYSFGVYNNNKNSFESFLVFKLSSPDLALSNMLGWEYYLPSDLDDLFKDTSKAAKVIDPNATSTPPTPTPPVQPGFKDRVLRNTDTRVYTDATGAIQFVYGFINKDYLIISGGVESFINIKTRLLNDNTLR